MIVGKYRHVQTHLLVPPYSHSRQKSSLLRQSANGSPPATSHPEAGKSAGHTYITIVQLHSREKTHGVSVQHIFGQVCCVTGSYQHHPHNQSPNKLIVIRNRSVQCFILFGYMFPSIVLFGNDEHFFSVKGILAEQRCQFLAVFIVVRAI